MSWIAVDKDGEEFIFIKKPTRLADFAWRDYMGAVEVPEGTAEKLTGKPMTWDDEPRELK